MKIEPPTPTRLQWNFNDELVKTIDNAYNDALKLAAVSNPCKRLETDRLTPNTNFPFLTGCRLPTLSSQCFWKGFHQNLSHFPRRLHSDGYSISLLPRHW